MSDRNDFETMRAALLAEAARPAAVRSWTGDLAWLQWVHLAVIGAALVFAAVGWGHPPAPRGVSGWLLLAAIVSGLVAVVALGRATRWWAAVSAVTGAVGVALHLAGYELASTAPFWADADCALAELAIAAVPAAVTIATLRRFAFQRNRAILGGVAAAATGLLVLDLTCPADSMAHAFSFHLLPALAVVTIASLVRATMTSHTYTP